jgi:predicted HTH transcriptional regulator
MTQFDKLRPVFLDQTTIEAPVHAQVEPAITFIKKNIALGSTIGEIYREDRWEYPPGGHQGSD